MSLRSRIAVIAAAAVAVTVIAVSLGVYVATARTLQNEVDRTLLEQAAGIARRPPPAPGTRTGRFGGPSVFVQVIDHNGIARGGGGVVLPVSDAAVQVAVGLRPAVFESATVDGVPLRILTAPSPRIGAVQFARPVQEMEQALARLRGLLGFGLLGGVLLAALLGVMVASRAVRPVHELTELAEEVAATQDLSRRIAAGGGDDELARLGQAMNTMLANLEQARAAQEQLVADASHELRTPLTSLRTNVEVLEQVDRLDPAARRALLRDVVAQLDEFGRLITGLVELARGARPLHAPTPLRLDQLVQRAVDRARTFAPDGREITLHSEPCTVHGEADQLQRAVSNLLDNALKYGGGPVEVRVQGGSLTVRDHGPGIGDADLPHIFDRFYRAPEARGAPGSGLGLSIVRQAADAHGGRIEARNAEGGGAAFTLTLPTVATPH